MAITKPTANLLLDKRTTYKNSEKHPVKLTIYYIGYKRRYKLPHAFTVQEWEKIYSLKLKDKVLREEKIKLEYYIGEKFDNALKVIGEPFTFKKFEEVYFNQVKPDYGNSDVYRIFNRFIEEQNSKDKVGNAKIYRTALNSFQGFRKKLNFEDITHNFLENYEKFMSQKGLGTNYISINLRCLRAIFNIAISEGIIDIDKYPFSKSLNDKKYKIKNSVNKKRALNKDELKILKSYVPKTNSEKRAYLIWWFSFYANGLNMKDICLLKYKNINGKTIEIIRRKSEHSTLSKKPIRIRYSDNIKSIINEIGNKDKSPNAHIFNIFHDGMSAIQEMKTVENLIKNVNKYMRKISLELKFDKIITTYWARHSFSTYMKRSGASLEIISEALGHSSLETTELYLDSFDEETLDMIADELNKI
jgi:integrase